VMIDRDAASRLHPARNSTAVLLPAKISITHSLKILRRDWALVATRAEEAAPAAAQPSRCRQLPGATRPEKEGYPCQADTSLSHKSPADPGTNRPGRRLARSRCLLRCHCASALREGDMGSTRGSSTG
jgi:hypothetical protein